MKILAFEHELPGESAMEFREHAKDEARRVWDLHQAGIIRELYFRADRNEAVLMLECASVDEAQEVLSSLPFVQNKLITFEIIPLKAYPGFERLFAKEFHGSTADLADQNNGSGSIDATIVHSSH